MMKLQLRSKTIVTITLLLILATVETFAQRRQVPQNNNSSSTKTADAENHRVIDLGAYELLTETNQYKLYSLVSPQCLYAPSRDEADLSLVLNVDSNFSVTEDNSIYKGIIENEVVPFLKTRCFNLRFIKIANFYKGVRLGRIKMSERWEWSVAKVFELNDPDFLNGGYKEFPAVSYWLEVDGNGRIKWDLSLEAGSDRTLANYRKRAAGDKEFLAEDEKRKAEEEKRRQEAIQKQKLELEQRKAEEKRQAELKEQKAKEEKLAAQKAKAGNVLPLYKKGAGQDYAFAGYTRQQSLQNIYKGNFEEFTGGYEQGIVNDTVRAQTSLYLSRAPLDDIFKENKRLTELMLKIAQLRAPIMIAYFAYHQAYEGQCSTNKEIAWMDGTRRVDLVRMRGAIEVSRIRGNTFYFSVREPFYDTFVKSLNVGTDGLAAELLTGTPASTAQEFQQDFVKFIKKEGCASAKVRHLETNLYLATEWLLPLQELLPPEMLQGQIIEENQKPQSEVKKAPATKKPTVKKRRKN